MTAPPERRAELTLPAPAKVNLYLQVLGRRPDGYHELVTVLQTVDLCDDVTVTLRPRARRAPAGRPDVRMGLRAPAPGVPDGPENLARRAAVALLDRSGAAGDVGVDIGLAKRIPAGGGLGGGSSDAAAVLRALDRLLGSPVGESGLAEIAAGLGSDVPFFLHGGTALCTGRGERVLPLAPPRPFGLTLLLPPFPTATAAVYAALGAGPVPPAAPPAAPSAALPSSLPASPPAAPVEAPADAPEPGAACDARLASLAERIGNAGTDALERLFRNDLEPAARRAEPRLAALLDATGLHLSGSGSTLFGFGRCGRDIESACESASICFVDSRI